MAVAKRKAYQKDDQPVKIDRSGGEGGDVIGDIGNTEAENRSTAIG